MNHKNLNITSFLTKNKTNVQIIHNIVEGITLITLVLYLT